MDKRERVARANLWSGTWDELDPRTQKTLLEKADEIIKAYEEEEVSLVEEVAEAIHDSGKHGHKWREKGACMDYKMKEAEAAINALRKNAPERLLEFTGPNVSSTFVQAETHLIINKILGPES